MVPNAARSGSRHRRRQRHRRMPGWPWRAAEQGPVVVVTKAALGEGSTRRAQGGHRRRASTGATRWRPTSPTRSRAGAGLCDVDAAARHLPRGARPRSPSCSPGAWRSTATADGLSLGREGAHSAARVVHAGGDATGAHIVAALTAAVRRRPAHRARRGRARPGGARARRPRHRPAHRGPRRASSEYARARAVTLAAGRRRASSTRARPTPWAPPPTGRPWPRVPARPWPTSRWSSSTPRRWRWVRAPWRW